VAAHSRQPPHALEKPLDSDHRIGQRGVSAFAAMKPASAKPTLKVRSQLNA